MNVLSLIWPRSAGPDNRPAGRGDIRSALIAFAFALSFAITPAMCQSSAPTILFTDLTSGPHSGGESISGYSGVYVTIYGTSFGTSQGSSTVTLGGGTCLRVVSWGTTWLWYQKIVVQLGASCSTGSLAVTTSAGTSNGLSFTVRSGGIYCVSTNGSDSNAGTFTGGCWRTVGHAALAMNAGSTVYVQNGVNETAVSSYSAVVNIQGNPGGTATNPIAIVGYPGATATIGSIDGAAYAIRVPQIGDSPTYYVIAGLTLRGGGEAMDVYSSDHWYVVGNDMSCDSAGGGYACFHGESSTNLYLYGNYVHDIRNNVKLFHSIYFTTNTNHVWVGWNEVNADPTNSGQGGCRGLQFYSTGGADMYDLHVHDNTIMNTICDGIAMTTVNANNGPVELYNNVIAHAGTSMPAGGLAHNTCLQIASQTAPTAAALVYNNSLYDCGAGAIGYGVAGCYELSVPTSLHNNTCYVTGGEPYLDSSSNSPCSDITQSSNNNWYGAGAPPCGLSEANKNPLYTSITPGVYNLRPTSTSPLVNAGLSMSSLGYDITGVARPQGTAYDIGAYEYFSGTQSQFSPCDLNQDGAVNSLDVGSAIAQAVGTAACGSADLQHSGSCNIVGVQRVTNASMGQACRVGP